jgi:hypothetical protein
MLIIPCSSVLDCQPTNFLAFASASFSEHDAKIMRFLPEHLTYSHSASSVATSIQLFSSFELEAPAVKKYVFARSTSTRSAHERAGAKGSVDSRHYL